MTFNFQGARTARPNEEVRSGDKNVKYINHWRVPGRDRWRLHRPHVAMQQFTPVVVVMAFRTMTHMRLFHRQLCATSELYNAVRVPYCRTGCSVFCWCCIIVVVTAVVSYDKYYCCCSCCIILLYSSLPPSAVVVVSAVFYCQFMSFGSHVCFIVY